MTEAGSTGIFLTKMPQSLRHLGAVPGAIFHNRVNHKQPAHSSPSRTYTSHTPGQVSGKFLWEITRSMAAAGAAPQSDRADTSLRRKLRNVHNITVNIKITTDYICIKISRCRFNCLIIQGTICFYEWNTRLVLFGDIFIIRLMMLRIEKLIL